MKEIEIKLTDYKHVLLSNVFSILFILSVAAFFYFPEPLYPDHAIYVFLILVAMSFGFYMLIRTYFNRKATLIFSSEKMIIRFNDKKLFLPKSEQTFGKKVIFNYFQREFLDKKQCIIKFAPPSKTFYILMGNKQQMNEFINIFLIPKETKTE